MDQGAVQTLTPGVIAADRLSGYAGEVTSPTVRQYVVWLVLAGTISLFILGVTALAGAIGVGLAVCGLVFIGLTLWRVEIGLFFMAALIPWELQTMLFSLFSVIKAAGIIVALLGLVRVLAVRGQRWPGIMKAAFAYGAWAIVSELSNLGETFQYDILQFSALISNLVFVFLIMRFCATPSALRMLLWVAAISSVSAAVAGLTEVAAPGFVAKAARLTTGVNTNTYVRYLFPGIFLSLALVAQVRRLVPRILLAAGIGLCLLTVIFTGARGGALGVVVGGLVVLTFMKGIPLGTRILVALGALILVSGVSLFAERYGAREQWAGRLAAERLAPDAETRFRRWRIAAEIGLDHPILGVGPGLQEGTEYGLRARFRTESHNDIISSLIRTGIPGMLLFLAILGAGYVGLWKLPPGLPRTALLGMWTAFIITGLFNPALNAKIWWLAAGVVTAAISCHRNSTAPTQEPRVAAGLLPQPQD